MPNLEGDGCSGGLSWAWRRLHGKPPPWEGCCLAHDEAYRRGGTAQERLSADKELRRCVTARCRLTGYSEAWGDILYWPVRAGGWRNAPPLHLLAWPAVKLGWATEFPDYRFGRVPPI